MTNDFSFSGCVSIQTYVSQCHPVRQLGLVQRSSAVLLYIVYTHNTAVNIVAVHNSTFFS